MPRRERSRSATRVKAPTAEEQEDMLADFARHFWLPPDSLETPPWQGQRCAQIVRYRSILVHEVEDVVARLTEDGCRPCMLGGAFLGGTSKERVARWQQFTFYDEVARMSDVLFRGPIEPRHADEFDMRLHDAWRRLRSTIFDVAEFSAHTTDFRVSAVRVAMMLETARPAEAANIDGRYELPDARTLSSLLSLRCEKDDVEELLELYRLVCQKLQGTTCAWCNEPFHEGSASGLFDGSDQFVVPATVPKVFVPQCGHAIHTVCFGSQLIPDRDSGPRGDCRTCGMPYAWTSIDVDPMINAFCLLFGPYVERRAQDMNAAGQLSESALISISEVCLSFSLELAGLVSATSAWLLLARRHTWTDPEVVEVIGEEVLRLLSPAPGPGSPGDEMVGDQAFLPEPPSPVMVDPGSPEAEADDFVPDLALPPPMEEHSPGLAEPPDSEPASEEEFEAFQDPGDAMLNQLVAGCGGDRNLNGLLPQP